MLKVPDAVDVRIFIVDNDPEASAAPIVEDLATTLPDHLAIDYRHEPTRGISHARNAAVRAATEWGAYWLCFIDDDERPDPAWLVEFLGTAERTGADIVSGPVLPEFEIDPPAWVIDGGFFASPRYPQDSPMVYATTSSVLIRRAILDPVDGPFDLAFSRSGGEDTHLFAQLREAGHRLAWSDTALVRETVPPSRVNVRWMLMREYRRGQTLSLSLRRRGGSRFLLARRGGKGGYEILAGIAAAIIGIFRGRDRVMKGARRVVFGAGILTGLVGYQHDEYATTHGR